MQLKKHSLLEVCISTAIGFVISFTANLVLLPIFGFNPSFAQNLWLTVFFTVISVIRSYYVRRLFNWLHVKEIL